ncbi:MAG: rhomboid family intramembrane serine protease [Gemmatimonadota bacterium]|nr:rhomboid family intramembrane serine protease [Gemmatimonadota bacterium]
MTFWVARLLAANVVVFLLTETVDGLWTILALRPRLVLQMPWTPFTYMFVHAGVWHIFFNMLTLFFFGPRVEERLGSQRFIMLYLLSGLGGAALSFLTPTVAIVGASGATFGVFLAYARFWPRDRIYIWGILPVEARVLVLITTLYSLWGGTGSMGGSIAHWAHLGGYAAAFLYLHWIEQRSDRKRFQKRMDDATFGKRTAATAIAAPDFDAIKREGLHELTLEELDRLRAKVNAEGIGSLTPDEKAFLHRMTLR